MHTVVMTPTITPAPTPRTNMEAQPAHRTTGASRTTVRALGR